MKLTWFGGSCLRLHSGGAILVFAPAAAPEGVDRGELVAGADRVVDDFDSLTKADPHAFRPRAALRLIEETEQGRAPELWQLAPGTALVDADGERPLILSAGALPALGRWAEKAVIVLAGPELAERAVTAVELVAPRLVALAGADAEIDAAFQQLSGRTGETALLALEPALAVEC